MQSGTNIDYDDESFANMPDIGEWRHQFRENRMDITAKMASHVRRWMETRDEISKLGSVTLIFSDEQKMQFDNYFRALFERCLKANENAMTASLARMAVNIVRIMVAEIAQVWCGGQE